jgi:polar amino acid transport system substrate-binding protein
MEIAVATLGNFHAKPFGPAKQVKQMLDGRRFRGAKSLKNKINQKKSITLDYEVIMRRKIAIVTVLIILVFIFFSVSQPKEITIVTFNYPPYMVNENGSMSGMFVEIVEEVFRRLKQPINIRFHPGLRSFTMMENNEVDGLFSVKKNLDREKTMQFPHEPLLKQDYVFFKLIDSNFDFNGDITSLQNVRIGVVNKMSYGPIFDKAFQEGVFRNIDTSPEMNVIFQKLIAKRMDVVIFSKDVGLSLIRKYGFQDQIIICGPSVETVETYIVFRHTPEGKHLSDSFDRIMNEMKKDGTLLQIQRKYD